MPNLFANPLSHSVKLIFCDNNLNIFGKDIWTTSEYYTYFRLLETGDEYFPYYRKRHAFWRIYGLELPDEVLKKVYYKNALGMLPNIDKSQFP